MHPTPNQIEHVAAEGYGFDYVMVFKAEEAGVMTEYAGKAIRQIIAAGLTVRVYFSVSGRDIFCEIRAPVQRLRQFADQVTFLIETKRILTSYKQSLYLTKCEPHYMEVCLGGVYTAYRLSFHGA